MAEHRIMVVEDEGIVAIDIKNTLERLGYEVSCLASSCQEAIEGAEASRPDLVLMDIRLDGDVDGIETAAMIRSRFDVPVIYLTAYADDDTLERAKSTQPFGYLLKPMNERELQTSIEIALYKHEMERKLRESEERFRGIAERSIDAIFTADLNSNIKYVSSAIKSISGYSPEEVIGKSLTSHALKSCASDALDAIGKVLMGQVIEGLALEIYRKDGSTAQVEVSASPIFEDGTVIGSQGIIRDITERRLVEEDLRKSNARYRAIVEDQTEMICRFLPDWRLTFVNGAYCRYFRKRCGDLVGNSFLSFVPDDDRPGAKVRIGALCRDAPTATFEHRVFLDGEERWNQWTYRAIFDQFGQVVEIQSAGRDITALKKVEEELRIARRELELKVEERTAKLARLNQELLMEITERKQIEERLRKSNARYRAIVEDQTELVCRFLMDGTFTFVNEAFCRHIGKSYDFLIGQSLFQQISEEDRSVLEKSIAALSQGLPTPLTGENRFSTPGREARWIQWTIKPIFGEYASLVELQAVGRDVTGHKRMEEALRASEERYKAVFNAVPIGIGIGDVEGNILAANREMLETKGLTLDELMAGGIFPVYADQRVRKKLMAAVQISGRVKDSRVMLRRKDESLYPAILNLELIDLSGKKLLLTAERQISRV